MALNCLAPIWNPGSSLRPIRSANRETRNTRPPTTVTVSPNPLKVLDLFSPRPQCRRLGEDRSLVSTLASDQTVMTSLPRASPLSRKLTASGV
jgi:hypothetical protein